MKITAINKLTLLAAMLIITLLNTHVVAAPTDSSGHWTCPMHPQIYKSESGACPICGMDLVHKAPQNAAEDGKDDNIHSARTGKLVTISSALENNLGVKTAAVKHSLLPELIDAVGYVQFNEDTLHHIHTRVEGWIERLQVDWVGDKFQQGEVLFELYSPELLNAQQEYVTALKSGNQGLIKASQQRLELLGINNEQINSLYKTRKVTQRLQVKAHRDGYISELNVRHGMYVTPKTTVMAMGQLDNVWVIAEVFERQAALLKAEQKVTMTVDSYPGRQWLGQVNYIYPVANRQLRTIQVRISFDNPGEDLKPNMFANVSIQSGRNEPTLNIPRSALIRAGSFDRVVLALGDGRYRAVAVNAGFESGDRVEILSGLAEHDRVVTSAQFLLDSESNLEAEMSRLEHVQPREHQHD